MEYPKQIGHAETDLASPDLDLLVRLDSVMIDSLGALIFNIGPPTIAISSEDVVCRAGFELAPDEPVPADVFTGLELIGSDQFSDLDLDESAPIPAHWFVWGLGNITCSQADRQLLVSLADALAQKQANTATPEQLTSLESNWPAAINILGRIFDQYIDQEAVPICPSYLEAERLQFLVYPVERRLQQLLDGFSPDAVEVI